MIETFMKQSLFTINKKMNDEDINKKKIFFINYDLIVFVFFFIHLHHFQ